MRERIACARNWLTGQERAVPVPDKVRLTKDGLGTFRMEAFVAGMDQAEGEFAVERATGQAQLDSATSLMIEAAQLFREYEQHHDRRAREGSDNTAGLSRTKAERNALMASRLEAWLRGEERFPVSAPDDEPEDVETRHHRDDCPAVDGFGCRCAELDDRDANEEAAPVHAVIGEDGDLIPVHELPGVITQDAACRIADRMRDDLSNVRPVTGPLAGPGVADALMAAIEGEPDAAALSMATAATFKLQTGDPRFDPAQPVLVNGFLYHPAKEA